jgi:hypothetical protein
MAKRQHNIPLGTKLSVEGESAIVTADCYQTILECPPDCAEDHDCFTEPHICVRKEQWTSVPLSKIRFVFERGSPHGRKYNG